MIICLGPVCVPLHLLLPFLIALAHNHGYLKWFKTEWVTFSWWRQQFNRLLGRPQPAAPVVVGAAPQNTTNCCSTEMAEGDGGDKGKSSAAAKEAQQGDGDSTAVAAGSAAGLRSRTKQTAA